MPHLKHHFSVLTQRNIKYSTAMLIGTLAELDYVAG
uniref:Uncharacterized protein n=1 Tax=Arundo donax TaxID=35708 RepID=A0A0A9GNV4_ARUDO